MAKGTSNAATASIRTRPRSEKDSFHTGLEVAGCPGTRGISKLSYWQKYFQCHASTTALTVCVGLRRPGVWLRVSISPGSPTGSSKSNFEDKRSCDLASGSKISTEG